MELGLLGSLQATAWGRSFVPTAGKPRQLLALLALHAGEMMPAWTLSEEIWGDAPPRSAQATLQTYVMQLRRLLGLAMHPDMPVDPKEILITCHSGYRLDIVHGTVDVQEFERLAASGQEALDLGNDEKASTRYGEALALWRGPAFVDVRTGPLLQMETTRLEHSRLAALERRNEADLRLGRHARLLSELGQLVVLQPLHEAFQAQFMVALYQAGQRWRALEVYQRLRRRMVDELGLEPSPAVCRLHEAMLRADDVLDLCNTHRGPLLGMFVS